MSKHTSGPWSHRNGRIFQTDRKLLTIAHVAYANDGNYSEANGQLLAAAPELLEALEKMVEIWETGGVNPYPIKEARVAIAKATGEQA